MIPLPKAWLLTSALLVGTAVGLILGIATTLAVDAAIRPDVVVGLVVGVPGILGMLTILLSGRRWVTTVGAFLLAVAPGWFGVLVAIQVVHGA
ncbi:putative holin [Mycolicibacterium phlei]